jgi:hypothetical protein
MTQIVDRAQSGPGGADVSEDPSAQPKEVVSDKTEEKPEAPALKTFTRRDVKRTVDVEIHFPNLLPGFEPFGFKFRLALSREAEEARQEYLDLPAGERTDKESAQALNEVCDLLTELPAGFGDLRDLGRGPGFAFRSYVETAEPDARPMLDMIVRAADTGYWGKIMPREFRR